MTKDYSIRQRKELLKGILNRDRKERGLLKRIKENPVIYGAIAGGILAIGITAGFTYNASKNIKPYTDKAAYQIEQKANDEKRMNDFLYNSWSGSGESYSHGKISKK